MKSKSGMESQKSESVKYFAPLVLFVLLFGVLIWDLHRVKELSDVIHDDHEDIWVTMNHSEISSWYSESDTCIIRKQLLEYESRSPTSIYNNLSFENTTIDYFKKLASNCSTSRTASNTLSTLKLKCSVGSSVGNRQCLPPYVLKKYYTEKLRDRTLNDPTNVMLRRVLNRFAMAKKPIVFLGDVVSKQNFDAMLCETLRSDRTWITMNIESFESTNSSLASYTIHWKGKAHSLRVFFLHMTHVVLRSTSGSASHDSAYDHDENYLIENSDSYDSAMETGSKAHRDRRNVRRHQTNTTQQAAINYSKQTTALSLETVRKQLLLFNSTFGGFALVANVGVWYNTRERFREEVVLLLRMLNEMGESNIVLFRESAAQHWNLTKHGYFPNGGNPSLGSCAPLEDNSPEYDWRNRDVKFTIENEYLDNIDIIPFRDITAALSSMHPDDRSMRDCTRFCYFPALWQIVWHRLDLASRNSTKLGLMSR